MDEQHGISSSLKIVGSFCLYMSIMVNELTEVIRVLSKIRVSEDNCSLFLTTAVQNNLLFDFGLNIYS